MAMEKSSLAELLQKAGLGDYVEAILQYAKPCIRLHAHPADDPNMLPLGASRIGGLPDLPPNVTWPTRNGRPCEFIAQINLSEASQHDETGLLPKDGMLLFFFDGRDYEDEVYKHYQTGAETIIYYTGAIESLIRAADYPSSTEKWQRYRPCSVTFETDWMLPSWGTAASIALEQELFGRITVYDPETPLANAYLQITEDLEPDEEADKHHLLGHPEPVIQDDPLSEVPGVIREGRHGDKDVLAEWMLLLQISSDDGPGMLWGDTSSVYYCIRKDDLTARRFDNAICIEQNC